MSASLNAIYARRETVDEVISLRDFIHALPTASDEYLNFGCGEASTMKEIGKLY